MEGFQSLFSKLRPPRSDSSDIIGPVPARASFLKEIQEFKKRRKLNKTTCNDRSAPCLALLETEKSAALGTNMDTVKQGGTGTSGSMTDEPCFDLPPAMPAYYACGVDSRRHGSKKFEHNSAESGSTEYRSVSSEYRSSSGSSREDRFTFVPSLPAPPRWMGGRKVYRSERSPLPPPARILVPDPPHSPRETTAASPSHEQPRASPPSVRQSSTSTSKRRVQSQSPSLPSPEPTHERQPSLSSPPPATAAPPPPLVESPSSPKWSPLVWGSTDTIRSLLGLFPSKKPDEAPPKLRAMSELAASALSPALPPAALDVHSSTSKKSSPSSFNSTNSSSSSVGRHSTDLRSITERDNVYIDDLRKVLSSAAPTTPLSPRRSLPSHDPLSQSPPPASAPDWRLDAFGDATRTSSSSGSFDAAPGDLTRTSSGDKQRHILRTSSGSDRSRLVTQLPAAAPPATLLSARDAHSAPPTAETLSSAHARRLSFPNEPEQRTSSKREPAAAHVAPAQRSVSSADDPYVPRQSSTHPPPPFDAPSQRRPSAPHGDQSSSTAGGSDTNPAPPWARRPSQQQETTSAGDGTAARRPADGRAHPYDKPRSADAPAATADENTPAAQTGSKPRPMITAGGTHMSGSRAAAAGSGNMWQQRLAEVNATASSRRPDMPPQHQPAAPSPPSTHHEYASMATRQDYASAHAPSTQDYASGSRSGSQAAYASTGAVARQIEIVSARSLCRKQEGVSAGMCPRQLDTDPSAHPQRPRQQDPQAPWPASPARQHDGMSGPVFQRAAAPTPGGGAGSGRLAAVHHSRSSSNSSDGAQAAGRTSDSGEGARSRSHEGTDKAPTQHRMRDSFDARNAPQQRGSADSSTRTLYAAPALSPRNTPSAPRSPRTPSTPNHYPSPRAPHLEPDAAAGRRPSSPATVPSKSPRASTHTVVSEEEYNAARSRVLDRIKDAASNASLDDISVLVAKLKTLDAMWENRRWPDLRVAVDDA